MPYCTAAGDAAVSVECEQRAEAAERLDSSTQSDSLSLFLLFSGFFFFDDDDDDDHALGAVVVYDHPIHRQP